MDTMRNPGTRSCIGCKRGVSTQWTMYECKCCCVTVCPECICEARLAIASLVKLDVASESTTTVQIQQKPSSETAVQPGPVAATRAVSTSIRVKRKPIPGASNSTSTNLHAMSQRASVPHPVQSSASSAATPYPAESADPASTSPIQSMDISQSQHPQSALTINQAREGAQTAQGSHPAVRPVYASEAQAAPFQGHPMQSRSVSTSQPQQQRPQLRQTHTEPATGLSASPGNILAHSKSAPNRPATTSNNRRSSVFSMATAKKLSQNKWVRSGAKLGAKYALRAVIEDAAPGWSNNGSSNNDDSSTGNVFSGLFNSESSGNNDDSIMGIFSSIPTSDNGNNDVSNANDIASGLWTGNDSNNDISSIADFGTTDQTDMSLGGYQSQDGIFDSTYSDQTTVNNTTSGYSTVDPSLATQPDYSGGYTYDTSCSDPSQGTQGYDVAAQQLQDAEDGLQNAEYNQNVAVEDGLDGAIDQANAVQGDEINNANADLAWGPDAIPDDGGGTYYEDDDGSNGV